MLGTGKFGVADDGALRVVGIDERREAGMRVVPGGDESFVLHPEVLDDRRTPNGAAVG